MAHIHEQVLAAANQIASERPDYTFLMGEIVRALPHLNESSVRTHVGSRCCINAPKHHPHRWDYFRRVGRGRYEVLAKHRSNREAQGESPEKRGSRRDTIHVVIHQDEGAYVADCLELPVVTQGGTLDEVVDSLIQAVTLHLEDEDLAALGLVDRPRLQISYGMPLAS